MQLSNKTLVQWIYNSKAKRHRDPRRTTWTISPHKGIQKDARKFRPAWFMLKLREKTAHLVLLLVGDEPRRARQQRKLTRQKSARERRPWRLDHHAFGVFQHERVVHRSDAWLYVLRRMTGKGAPGTEVNFVNQCFTEIGVISPCYPVWAGFES